MEVEQIETAGIDVKIIFDLLIVFSYSYLYINLRRLFTFHIMLVQSLMSQINSNNIPKQVTI